jgi:anti-sigma B factor antagonist
MTSPSGSEWFHNVLLGGRERPYSSAIEVVGDAGVVAVSGEMDLATAARFKDDLDEAIAATCGDLVLDLSDLDMIDSTALGVMLRVLQRLSDEGRWLILVVTQPRVMRILTITGLQTTFRITPSRSEALQQVVAPVASRRVA